MWRGFVGSCWLGPGCPVLRVDTRENPVGKNGVMTILPKFDEPFNYGSIFGKILGEPMLVDVRVILLVEADKMGEYLHPHVELKTPRVYTMVMDTSTRRWAFTSPKIRRTFRSSVPF